MVKNSAFMFLKPHAVTDACKELMKKAIEEKGLTIKAEGSLEAEEIDKKQLIDKHYYAIASKATLLTPDKLNVPKEKFKEQFDLDWDAALKTGNVLNAKDACAKLEFTADQLDTEWAKAKKAKKLVKFGGGFYCGLIEVAGKDPLYVFNGFFMAMRSKFVAPGVSIYYYVVEWESKDICWEDFRAKVCGPTDPESAPAESLRGMIYKDWKSLGLKAQPDVGDNAVHASASPFEALAERMNWLGYRVDRDAFGKTLLKAGVTRKQIKDWSVDPQVTYGPVPIKKSLFDSLEDTDSDYCTALCQMISGCLLKDPEKDKEIASLEAKVASLKEQVAKYTTIAEAIKLIKGFTPMKDEPAKGKGKGESSKGKGKGKGGGKEEPAPKKKGRSRKNGKK